jgi:DGQHR domain-containing protein
MAHLILNKSVKALAQVDCQHRLGELAASEIPLAFMAFMGLDLRSEMAMFTVINSKAKGLSSSLTDYHNSNLIANLFADAPHLYIARRLNDDQDSPWFKLIRLGGKPTPGLKRRTSLRMMQTAVDHFLSHTSRKTFSNADIAYGVVADFWRAVAQVFSAEWCDPRHHLLTKGVGLHSLMHIAADIVNNTGVASLDKEFFVQQLSALKGRVDWRSNGEFSSAGGKKGVTDVTSRLKEALQHANLAG